MTKQHEALRLAHAIDPGDEGSKTVLTIDVSNAAKELRRLHEVNAELLEVMQNVEALGMLPPSLLKRVRLSIAKATGETE